MPRRARHYLVGLPYHVVQRGNNREPCFIEPENYQFYLGLWQELSQRYGVAVHAYCLMTNHIHFLVTPLREGAVSDTMKVVGSRYAQYINLKYKRTGTLWEGRHRASLVHAQRYFLTCHRYIELNPVRASMVEHPGDYKWSSYRANAQGESSWLSEHDEYLCLGVTAGSRREAYRVLFNGEVDVSDLHRIRTGVQYCHPVGDDRFCQFILERYGVEVGLAKRGRPPKSEVVKK